MKLYHTEGITKARQAEIIEALYEVHLSHPAGVDRWAWCGFNGSQADLMRPRTYGWVNGLPEGWRDLVTCPACVKRYDNDGAHFDRMRLRDVETEGLLDWTEGLCVEAHRLADLVGEDGEWLES